MARIRIFYGCLDPNELDRDPENPQGCLFLFIKEMTDLRWGFSEEMSQLTKDHANLTLSK
jgi:hypothetical protein